MADSKKVPAKVTQDRIEQLEKQVTELQKQVTQFAKRLKACESRAAEGERMSWMFRKV